MTTDQRAIGYVRDDIDNDQQDKIEAYALRENITLVMILRDSLPDLETALRAPNAPTTLLVTSPSRITRKVPELKTLVQGLSLSLIAVQP